MTCEPYCKQRLGILDDDDDYDRDWSASLFNNIPWSTALQIYGLYTIVRSMTCLMAVKQKNGLTRPSQTGRNLLFCSYWESNSCLSFSAVTAPYSEALPFPSQLRVEYPVESQWKARAPCLESARIRNRPLHNFAGRRRIFVAWEKSILWIGTVVREREMKFPMCWCTFFLHCRILDERRRTLSSQQSNPRFLRGDLPLRWGCDHVQMPPPLKQCHNRPMPGHSLPQ